MNTFNVAIKPTIYTFEHDGKIIVYNNYTLQKFFGKKGDKTPISTKYNNFVKIRKTKVNRFRLEVTLNCNCDCDYCLVKNNDISEKGEYMTLNTAKKIVHIFNNSIKNGSILLMGGEPLLNWKVTRWVIENAKGRIYLFTNGTLVNHEIAKFLSKNDVVVSVSLDGKKENNKYRKYKNGDECFDECLMGYNLLKQVGCNVGLACLATKPNIPILYEITKYFVEDLNVKYIGISIPHYTEENNFAEIDIKEYVKQLIKIFKLAKKVGIYVDQLSKRLAPLVNEEFNLTSCKIAGEQMTFYPSGRQTLCTKLDTDKNWRKLTARQLLNKTPLYNEYCKNCPAIGICGGGCFWDRLMLGEREIDIRECYINRKLLDYFLWDMYKEMKKWKVKPSKDFFQKIYGSVINFERYIK